MTPKTSKAHPGRERLQHLLAEQVRPEWLALEFVL